MASQRRTSVIVASIVIPSSLLKVADIAAPDIPIAEEDETTSVSISIQQDDVLATGQVRQEAQPKESRQARVSIVELPPAHLKDCRGAGYPSTGEGAPVDTNSAVRPVSIP
jgi:hypothetical protein